MVNRVSDLLDIDHPIIQGGMTWVSDASLASAVSNGGGLGIIGAGAMPAEMLKEEIRKTRELTDRPFGVNMIMITHEFPKQLEIVLAEKPPVVTLGAVQNTAVIPALKEQGIKVLPVVAAVAIARRAEQHGADAIIAEGCEAGGHIGETTTMVLTPLVAKSVDVPVIAAGGIVDGAALVAAFALGAEGVQMGTRFVCASECTVHDAVKQRYMKSGDRATVVTARAVGYPVRSIKNKLAGLYAEKEKDFLQGKCTAEDIENMGLGKLREAMREGNVRDGSMMAGQCVALVDKVQPAADIIAEIISEAEAVAAQLPSKLALRR
ncbi:MAG: nitronate monooxygenase family protein [Actinobacteria bacterium]|nr:nitronate monooxygenase family protein [Actinomycetota bacterium]MCL5882520.1 nitronate monooxygenase family protein [Actinomycetota bacterium]